MFIKKSFITICTLLSIIMATNAYSFDFKDVFSSKDKAESSSSINDLIALNRDTTLKEALEKSKKLRESFKKNDFETIEKSINEERAKGYYLWGQGSPVRFYLYYLSSISTNDKDLLSDLEKGNLWIEHLPNSSYAYSFRGATYAQLAWDARGTKYASDTPKHKMDKMVAYFESAYDDLFKAVEFDQKNAHAWREIIQISKSAGIDRERKNFIFETARENLPNYYSIYADYISSLRPKWGGSEEELFDFARNTDFPEQIRARLLIYAHTEWGEHKGIILYRQDRRNNWREIKKEYLRRKDVKEEIGILIKKSIEKYPKFTWLQYNYANHLWLARRNGNIKDDNEALKYYNNTIDLNPRVIGAEKTYWLASQYLLRNDQKQAAKYLEKYLDAFPNDKEMGNKFTAADVVAWHYSNLGRFKKAEPFHKMAVEIQPESVGAQASYCNVLHSVHKNDEAIKYCETAIKLNPDFSWAYFILSQIYKDKGDHIKSQEYMNRHKNFESH